MPIFHTTESFGCALGGGPLIRYIVLRIGRSVKIPDASGLSTFPQNASLGYTGNVRVGAVSSAGPSYPLECTAPLHYEMVSQCKYMMPMAVPLSTRMYLLITAIYRTCEH